MMGFISTDGFTKWCFTELTLMPNSGSSLVPSSPSCSPYPLKYPPLWTLSKQSAYFRRIYSRVQIGLSNYLPQMIESALANQQGFSQAARPIMHPYKLYAYNIWWASLIVLIPPLMVNFRWGKSYLSLQTRSYCNGGTLLFWAGFNPFKKAFLAWIIKWSTLPSFDTSPTKFRTNSQESNSSTPSLHLTVQLTPLTLSLIAFMHWYTSSGSFMRQAPKDPSCTRGLGQPTLRLISSYPYLTPIQAASANLVGSEPPSWSTTGCSDGWKGRSPAW